MIGASFFRARKSYLFIIFFNPLTTQFGFRPKLSRSTAFAFFTDTILENADNGLATASSVGQYWLIIKINGTNSVNFVGNSVNFVGNMLFNRNFS
jgi:hypothetical protein